MAGTVKTRAAPCGRLAPSPTGALHLGNVRTFMVAWLSARGAGGRVVLRIEDLDHPKNKPWAAGQAVEDLRWLGFDWDEGPDVGGPHAPYRQTERKERYAAALETLKAKGLAYPCVCTRRDVENGQSAPHAGEMMRYEGRCRGRFPDFASARAAAQGRTPAWRFLAEGQPPVSFVDGYAGQQVHDVAATCGDFVLARDEFGAGYMLAVVVDDAAMGVTEVVRGDDLLEATAPQLLVARALGLPAPRYVHVPLVVGPDGRRLAKRHGDTRVAAFREAGVPARRIIGLLAWTCGWAERGEELSLADLLPRFNLESIPRPPCVLSEDMAQRGFGPP